MSYDIIEKSRSIFRTLKDKGFFYLLSANFVIGFLGFGSQLLVAKFLTPLEIGQIKTMQSFAGVAAIVAGFGFNTAVLKLCSEKRPLTEKAFILKKSMVFSITPVILVLLILIGLAKLNLLSPDHNVNSWMIIYALVIPFMAYTSLLIVYLQALKKIKLMAKTQTAIRLIGFLGLVLATYFIGFSGFVYATILVAAVALVPLFLLVKNDLQISQNREGIFKESFYYARWSVAANMVSTIGSYLDIFLLTAYTLIV